jgi:hypothetical protein
MAELKVLFLKKRGWYFLVEAAGSYFARKLNYRTGHQPGTGGIGFLPGAGKQVIREPAGGGMWRRAIHVPVMAKDPPPAGIVSGLQAMAIPAPSANDCQPGPG